MTNIAHAGVLKGRVEEMPPSPSPSTLALRRLARNRSALAGLLIVTAAVVCSVLAPFVAPYNPIKMQPSQSLQAPSRQHWMGTDVYGRDIFSRVVHGTGISLKVGLVSVVVGASAGIVLGFLAGYFGGVVDEIVSRLIDVLLAFPGLLLALTLVAFLGPGQDHVIIALGIASVPTYTRLVRSTVLATKHNLYVEAARALGCGPMHIAVWHIFPNAFPPLIVVATLGVAWAIMNGAALSFLGLGAKPPAPEWGTMLSEGRDYLRVAPWITTFPGLAIMALVIGVNLLGDGLRVSLDPRVRR